MNSCFKNAQQPKTVYANKHFLLNNARMRARPTNQITNEWWIEYFENQTKCTNWTTTKWPKCYSLNSGMLFPVRMMLTVHFIRNVIRHYFGENISVFLCVCMPLRQYSPLNTQFESHISWFIHNMSICVLSHWAGAHPFFGRWTPNTKKPKKKNINAERRAKKRNLCQNDKITIFIGMVVRLQSVRGDFLFRYRFAIAICIRFRELRAIACNTCIRLLTCMIITFWPFV